MRKNIITALVFLSLFFTFSVSVNAKSAKTAKKPGEYKAIVSHLKTKYRAKKVKIPLMFLARFAVNVVRPAGVKSFSVTIFEDLKFSRETLDQEMQNVMRRSFDANWSPILRVRSRTGEQIYMYMRESGSSVKLSVVTIAKEQAAIIRATINPEKLAEFLDDPKIFGISLNDKESNPDTNKSKPEEQSLKKD